MTRFLLDVNVLIALVDPAHMQHEAAHEWFAGVGSKSFATCPITENGLLRILGHPKYPNSPGPPSVVATSLSAIRQLKGHEFWPDTVSLADDTVVNRSLLSNHSRVTDNYLLALSKAHKGRLATLDHKLFAEAVAEGKTYLMLI